MKQCKVCNTGVVKITSHSVRNLFFMECTNRKCKATYEERLRIDMFVDRQSRKRRRQAVAIPPAFEEMYE